jgi:anti-sigma regulatory factor (Ser/Thr protein kinase)
VVARRAVAEIAHDCALSERVVHDGALAMSELVTNAVLHARTPIHVRVRAVGSGVRIEVEDGNPYLPPVQAARPEDLLSNASMTGRGLALVAAVCDGWGSESTGMGKVTWAEVGTGERGRHRSSGSGGSEGGSGRSGGVMVKLLGVPVGVLLESTRQLSDLQREMQVMGVGPNPPDDLAQAVAEAPAWFEDLDSWTDSDRLRAEEALLAGHDTVDFEVFVPEDVVGRITGMATWIARTTGGIRRRDLLTLPASSDVVAYRYWYAEEIVRQMAGRAARPYPARTAPQEKV